MEEMKEKKSESRLQDSIRIEHYNKVQQRYKTLDNTAFKAGKDHISDVEHRQENKR